MVPCPGTSLPSTGFLGWVPPLHRYYGGTRTPRHPSRGAWFPSLRLPPKFIGRKRLGRSPKQYHLCSRKQVHLGHAVRRRDRGSCSPRGFTGGADAGTTHLACARGHERIKPGYRVLFVATFREWVGVKRADAIPSRQRAAVGGTRPARRGKVMAPRRCCGAADVGWGRAGSLWGQPEGVRSEGPSMRTVWQWWRRRLRRAPTISLRPRKPYQSS